MKQGSIWWADLPEPSGSRAGFTRPVVVLQANQFNQSAIQTIIVAALSSNPKLANAPGNVWIEARESGLVKDSVIVISQVQTLDKRSLREYVGQVGEVTADLIDHGLGLIFKRG